ncbi:M24 family metallopeptidase [Kribbella sp. NPDC059898]|uniref:M24 family metallopeptidase n=1 Tax=Kribbella sp. NPDC059898 TaxID=3346995 RepID=UPI0036476E5F
MTHEIPVEVLRKRLDRVRGWMAEQDVDVLIGYGAPGWMGSRTLTAGYVRYLTGWTSSGLPAMVVLPREGTASIITMGPHDTRAFELRSSWFGDIERAGAATGWGKTVSDHVRRLAPGRVATFGFGEVPYPLAVDLYAALDGHPQVDAEPTLDAMRLVRDPEEIEMHRIGAGISDAMIQAAMAGAVADGMTGDRLMATIENTGRLLGAGTPGTWLTLDEHPVTTYMEAMEIAKPVGPNDRVQLGTNLSYQGYFAQGLRIGVRGKPSAKLREYAEHLIEIQDAGLAAMVPGAKLHTVSDAIESGIDKFCPYERDKDPFRFQSCHGLGLNYVEPGMARDLNARRDKSRDGEDGVTIVEGMVIEVHPNFTTPEVGHVCAGDMALVTSTGAEWLTKFPRGLFQL